MSTGAVEADRSATYKQRIRHRRETYPLMALHLSLFYKYDAHHHPIRELRLLMIPEYIRLTHHVTILILRKTTVSGGFDDMRTYNKIMVSASLDAVWEVLADQFTQNDKWMAQVYKTRDTDNAEAPDLTARDCELTPSLDGIRTHEEIILYDRENYVLKFTVKIRNGGKFPVKMNIATVSLASEQGETSVEWVTNPSLKPMGYAMYPLLKAGIQKSFKGVLEELKYYVENGKPHPRKIEAMSRMKSEASESR